MNTDTARFQGKHSELTDMVLKASCDVCNDLVRGFLEGVYHPAVKFALVEAGLDAVSQAPVPVYLPRRMVAKFRADFVVEGEVLLELKAGTLDRSHFAQVLNYLKSTSLDVALVLSRANKPQLERFVMDDTLKQTHVPPCESAVSF